jgi:hypothetical protein
MAGETLMHKTLKKEACRWMFRQGYRSVAAEVKIPPLGIIDAVGCGVFRAYHNYLSVPYTLPQSVFIECKASRGDFLRDCCRDPKQLKLALKAKREDYLRRGVVRRHRKIRGQAGLGKFKSCLLTPMAHLHYVMAPVGLLKKSDLPPRWGLLTLGETGVNVTVRAEWVEVAAAAGVEGCIARTLTGDLYRADDRAMASINREMFAQQQQLAEKIRALGPTMLEQQRAAATIDRPAKMSDPAVAGTLFPAAEEPVPITAGSIIRPTPKRPKSRRTKSSPRRVAI